MNLDLIPNELDETKKVLFKLKPLRTDGLLLNLHNPKPTTRFVQSCFHETRNILSLIDNDSYVVVIDYELCKLWRLPRQENVTCATFSNFNDEELIIGRKDGHIHVVNYESGILSDSLKLHRHPVRNLSLSRKKFCLSSSERRAVLWDLRGNVKLQVLYIERDNSLKYVTFIPGSCHVLACFQDDIVQIWNTGNFNLVKELSPVNWRNYAVRSIAFTKNGQIMVVSGYVPTLAVFSLDTWKLTKLITLPEDILTIKHVDFVSRPFDGGCNKTLAILSGHGALYFYDIENDVIISELHAPSEISRFALCPRGRYISCVFCSGEVGVYNLERYTSPVVEVKTRRVWDKRNSRKRTQKEMIAIKAQINEVLDVTKLKKILKKFGEYPATHRLKIWEKLLQLPNNLEAYNTVINHVTVASFEDLYRTYPLENKISIQALRKLLNNLVTWCSFFATVQYLPVFTFPFVKVFQNRPVACFEAVCTIIINWCQYWFEYFPLPPVNVLAITENVLLEHDPDLLNHFTEKSVNPTVYAWILLETSFSESLSAPDWLILWDHILTNEPAFLLCAVVAYNIVQKPTLTSLEHPKDYETFYRTPRPVDVKKLLRTSYRILETTGVRAHPRQYLQEFYGLREGAYPVFVKYPDVMLNVQQAAKEVDEELRAVIRDEKEIVERVRGNKGEEGRRVVEMEEAKRRKAMEAQHLQIIKSKQDRLKLEKDRLQKMKQQVDFPMDKFREDKEKCLQQLKTILDQKWKIDGLLSTTSDESSLNEKIKKLQRDTTSMKQVKKVSMAASLAILDNVIRSVEKELEDVSSEKSVDILKSLQAETKTLEAEIKKLKQLVSTNKHIPGPPRAHMGEGDNVNGKQVRFSKS